MTKQQLSCGERWKQTTTKDRDSKELTVEKDKPGWQTLLKVTKTVRNKLMKVEIKGSDIAQIQLKPL